MPHHTMDAGQADHILDPDNMPFIINSHIEENRKAMRAKRM